MQFLGPVKPLVDKLVRKAVQVVLLIPNFLSALTFRNNYQRFFSNLSFHQIKLDWICVSLEVEMGKNSKFRSWSVCILFANLIPSPAKNRWFKDPGYLFLCCDEEDAPVCVISLMFTSHFAGVIRFCEILPLEQNFKMVFDNFQGLLSICQKYLDNFLNLLGNNSFLQKA